MGRHEKVEERRDRLAVFVRDFPGTTIDRLYRLDVYLGCANPMEAVRGDLRALVTAGRVHQSTAGVRGYPAEYRAGPPPEGPPREVRVTQAVVPSVVDPEFALPETSPEPGGPPWTLEELLYWLAASEEAPADCAVARSFEWNRRKAVAAVRAAIDLRDITSKGT